MRITAKWLLIVDRWLMIPNHWTARLGSKQVKSGDSENVVLIKLMGMGSIIRLLSLCRKSNVDFSKIRLITFSSNREACEMMGMSHGIYVRTNGLFSFLADCWRIRALVRNLEPKWIIDFERCSNAVSLFRQWLSAASGARTISFDTGDRTINGDHLYFDVTQLSFHEILTKGISHMPKSSLKLEKALLPSIHANKVIVNINCSDYLLARRYPRNLFQVVITQLCRTSSLQVFLTGSTQEYDYVEKLAADLHSVGIQAENVAGHWPLKELENELSTAALFISGDSGPLHLAADLGTPTIAIWGPTQPVHFHYESEKNFINITLALSCSPCFSHPKSVPAVACKGSISCLRDLNPEEIVAAAEKLLSHAKHQNTNLSPAVA